MRGESSDTVVNPCDRKIGTAIINSLGARWKSQPRSYQWLCEHQVERHSSLTSIALTSGHLLPLLRAQMVAMATR